jgi:glucose-6-phosphate isomerase
MLAARYRLDLIATEWEAAVADLAERRATARLWGHDSTLFADDPTEISNRMGWLDVTDFSRERWADLEAAAAELAGEVDHVVVAGMGGSSLFPEVLASTFGSGEGFPTLHVLDTTDPVAVRRVLDACPAERTFVVASSKSGTTLETRSHLELFWDRAPDPARFGVVTDPGSALAELARERRFRHVWENDPDIGGRYSALSLFGMVPAALSDVDGIALLDAADDMAEGLQPVEGDDEPDPGMGLGAAIGAAAKAGRDKLTILLDPSVASFGLWLEQLVAESLGKHGVGAVPIVDEPFDIALAHPDDRLFVVVGDAVGAPEVRASGQPCIELSLEDPSDLGAHVLLWEVAVALAGRVLGINPFDQPDVEAAKAAARALLDSDAPAQPDPTPLEDALGAVRPGDYLAICAFVDPGSKAAAQLVDVRAALGRRLGVATTLGIGPRFLHSTGQLHKGGAHDGVFLQVLDTDGPDLAIPGQAFTFGELKAAQAAGDLQALRDAGQDCAYRVELADLLAQT